MSPRLKARYYPYIIVLALLLGLFGVFQHLHEIHDHLEKKECPSCQLFHGATAALDFSSLDLPEIEPILEVGVSWESFVSDLRSTIAASERAPPVCLAYYLA